MQGSLYFWMGLVGLLGGAGLLAFAAARSFRARQVSGWRIVPGYVRHARVVEHRDGFEPQVTYEYAVDGMRLEGHTISEGGVLRTAREWADALVLRYAPETVADVHVDPDDPQHAVLEARSTAAPAAIAGSLLALASVTVLFAAWLVAR